MPRPWLAALTLTACVAAQAGAASAEPAPAFGHFGGYQPGAPAAAPAGECYARIARERRPSFGPPQAEGARWELDDRASGQVWCLVPTGEAQPLVTAPESDGWVRVRAGARPARVRNPGLTLVGAGYR